MLFDSYTGPKSLELMMEMNGEMVYEYFYFNEGSNPLMIRIIETHS